MRITLAQLNLLVGDVQGNTGRVIRTLSEARDVHGADLVVFQELALCGYPTEDLLFHAGLRAQVGRSLETIREAAKGICVLVGYPEYQDDIIYNSAAVMADGVVLAKYRKRRLPNYAVFDEQRYFTAGDSPLVVDIAGTKTGIALCEDVWVSQPCAELKAAGAELIVVANGSPYKLGKQAEREAALVERTGETDLPVVYQNMIGGQDELVFDGGSCMVSADGEVVMRAPAFRAGLFTVELQRHAGKIDAVKGPLSPLLADDASVYEALVTGVQDYVAKNGFRGVVLGLSGGLDSALTLAVAVDALGPQSVQAIMMPFTYTSDMSMEDAEEQANLLGVDYRVVPIQPMVEATREVLAPLCDGDTSGVTEENIQARCRGMLLMAVSNRTGRMVLATGNKSEMAVGYATLYGDMAGGYAPIKDCTKTRVYSLARYRNTRGRVIPQRVLTRPPSAELAPDQKDTDTLPPYDVLDGILDALMMGNQSVDQISEQGFDHATVERVLDMVRRNEYKRRQAPPGVRISGRAFGRDWRYPITSGYRYPGRFSG